jgi:adenine-specific DNA methylase
MEISKFPSTRYQGSKRKLVRWIAENIADLPFDSALDLFGGTGSVGYLFKTLGKQVIYNDLLRFNHTIGLALIENAHIRLSEEDITLVITSQPDIAYPDFIACSFSGIYFTDEENSWLDRAVYHIDHLLTDPYKQALARFALYQACLAKRPYNLFHRANLYMRQAQVKRSFGNKATWDRPFEDHFRAYAREANAAVFDNGRSNRAICGDALDAPQNVDLVYIDPPYISATGVGVDYHGFYHFLDGLTAYQDWPTRIDYRRKHRALQPQDSPWIDPDRILEAFEAVIARYQHRILVISYRDNGIPAKDELITLLHGYKSEVREAQRPQQYALSTRQSHELLLIAR